VFTGVEFRVQELEVTDAGREQGDYHDEIQTCTFTACRAPSRRQRISGSGSRNAYRTDWRKFTAANRHAVQYAACCPIARHVPLLIAAGIYATKSRHGNEQFVNQPFRSIRTIGEDLITYTGRLTQPARNAPAAGYYANNT